MTLINKLPASVPVSKLWLARITKIPCCICNREYSFDEVQRQIRNGAEWHYVTVTSKLICAECVHELGIKTINAPAGAES